jgi:hypothetical protein
MSSASSPTATPSSVSSAPCSGEQHDEWTEGCRYLGLDVLTRSRVTLVPNPQPPTPNPQPPTPNPQTTPNTTQEMTTTNDIPALSA